MKKLIIFTVFLLLSCSKNEQEVKETSKEPFVQEKTTISLSSIPFTRVEELNTFSEYPEIVNYQLARKVAFIELKETGFAEEMGWGSFTLSATPIVIYNLKSIPRYYDYIVLDPEEKPIGILRVNATRSQSPSIKNTYTKIMDYQEILKQTKSEDISFFSDWKNVLFIGKKGDIGEPPTQLINIEKKEMVNQNEVKELEGEEIIDYLSENLLQPLISRDENVEDYVPEHLLKIDSIHNEIMMLKELTISQMRDSLQKNLNETRRLAKEYWKEVDNLEQEILKTNDAEIIAQTKFFGFVRRFFKRIFGSTEVKRDIYKYIPNIGDDYLRYQGKYCGPWVCYYILYKNKGLDYYNFFESQASTYNTSKIIGLFKKDWGDERPMYPDEIKGSISKISNYSIWVSARPVVMAKNAFEHIYYNQRPVIILCWQGKGLHWTLGYGVRRLGTLPWRYYYFKQIDNGAKIRNHSDLNGYHSLEWWNLFFFVYD